ncbi:MAG: type II toxin-antitoxin system VapC family toxin [Chloroflexi bacterium]|nr:type II toxin-antitoxin system VapC family toxin [Chloroflexota bacterium]MYD49103.1 type II toxin-antitoxin system VapC family toxin [Chloroflexota bacterium]
MTTILDTNVASEIVSPRPDPGVMAWWRRQVLGEMFTTAVTEAEMRYGLAIMPAGHRRSSLLIRTDHLLRVYLAARILPFDSAAAQIYADIRSHRRRIGRRIEHPDAQIAAIARSAGMAVATRDVGDFADCGVELVNPWATEGTA